VPRLQALNADLKHVTIFYGMRGTDGLTRLASIIEDRVEIAELMARSAHGLLVVDPLFSALRTARAYDSHKYAEMMQVLTQVSQWCEQSRVTLLGIVHRKKSRGERLLDDIQGSGALGATPRCVSFIDTEEDDEEDEPELATRVNRLFRTVKHSNSPRPQTRRFWLEPDPSLRAAPALRWDMDPVARSAERAAFQSDAAERPSLRASKALLCAEWLLDTLTLTAPTPALDLKLAASKKGWDQSVLTRASTHALLKARGYRIDKTLLVTDTSRAWVWQLTNL
jgi:hypothetical protein